MSILDDNLINEFDNAIILASIYRNISRIKIWDYENVVDMFNKPLKVGDLVLCEHINCIQPAIITSIKDIRCALTFSGDERGSRDRNGEYRYDYNVHSLIKITKEDLLKFYNLLIKE